LITKPQKSCDGCRKVVAIKYARWNTVGDYITVRADDVPGYICPEATTIRSELHYCKDCWNNILNNIVVQEVQ
jgi:hypothetical protein